MNDNHKINCEFAGEIVPYLYAELADGDRGRFETHLADCMECTDEFAGISDARFSVLEWQLGEFAELETPKIVIPYGRDTVSSGWLTGLRDLLTLSGSGSAAAVAAALMIVIGVGYLMITRPVDPSPMAELPPVPQVRNVMDQVNPQPAFADPEVASANAVPPRGARPVKAKLVDRKSTRAGSLQASVKDARTSQPSGHDQAIRTKPVLSTFEDEDDRSLRLADLLDDGEAGS